jgi:CheY-like chemotaxis protein
MQENDRSREAILLAEALGGFLELLKDQPLTEVEEAYVDAAEQKLAELKTLLRNPANTSGERESEIPHTILVVDDDAVQRLWVAKTLREAGFAVSTAQCSDEALRKLSTGYFQAVVMDCEIPEPDGFETTRRIRQNEQESGSFARIPILAYSSYSIAGYREMCLSVGMNEFLRKPASPADLLNAVRRTLQKVAAPSRVTP